MASKTPMVHTIDEESSEVIHLQWRAILLLAVGARLLLALVSFEFHPIPPLTSWGYENIAIARSLYEGHGFSSPFFSASGPTAFMAPGYPLFLAAVMAVFGTGSLAATAVIVVQEVFSLLTLILVMIAARRQFGFRTANIAGFICSIAPPMLMAPVWIWDTSFSALAIAAALAATSVLARMKFIPAGAACAIAGLVNPSLIPSLWLICGWSAWKAKKIPWLGVLAFFVVFAPWPARNAVVMHQFIPLRTDFGYELWMGNHSGANGNPDESLNPMTSREERSAFVQMGELRYLHEKGVLAKSWIRSEPARFVKLSLQRFARFWTGGEQGLNLITLTLSVFSVWGLVLLWRERRDLAILYTLPLLIFPLPYYFTLVIARFQYVIGPLLVSLTSYVVAALLRPNVERS